MKDRESTALQKDVFGFYSFQSVYSIYKGVSVNACRCFLIRFAIIGRISLELKSNFSISGDDKWKLWLKIVIGVGRNAGGIFALDEQLDLKNIINMYFRKWKVR